MPSCQQPGLAFWSSRMRSSKPGMAASIAVSVSWKPESDPKKGSGTPEPGTAVGSNSVSRRHLARIRCELQNTTHVNVFHRHHQVG